MAREKKCFLKKCFLFATSQIHFISNEKFYYRIDGVAMGSLLAFVIGNICLGFYKSKWLNGYNLTKPKFYLRYVNNILGDFGKDLDLLDFYKLFK